MGTLFSIIVGWINAYWVFFLPLIALYVLYAVLVKNSTIPYLFLVNTIISVVMFFVSSQFIVFLFYYFLGMGAILVYRQPLAADSEGTYMDYKWKIRSISGIINKLQSVKEGKNIIIGEILPVDDSELKYNKKKIVINEKISQGHIFMTGASGSGKTYFAKSILKQHLKNNKKVMFVDYKGDNDLLKDLKKIAKEYGKKFYFVSPYGINFSYDAFKNIDKAGKMEMILNMRKWSLDGSDAHFKSLAQLFIQTSLEEFENTWNKHGNYLVEYYKFIKNYKYKSMDMRGSDTVKGLIEIILSSEIKNLFLNPEDLEEFDFRNDEEYLILFSFNSNSKELMSSLTSFVFKDMLDAITKGSVNGGLAVIVDEFGSLENSYIVKDAIEKGRSGGLEAIIMMQNLHQIIMNSSEAFLQSLLGTANTFIVFAGLTKDAAEIYEGRQTKDIKDILMDLQKPVKNSPPTAYYISDFSTINSKNREKDSFRFIPWIERGIIRQPKQKIAPKTSSDESKISKNIKNDSKNTYFAPNNDFLSEKGSQNDSQEANNQINNKEENFWEDLL